MTTVAEGPAHSRFHSLVDDDHEGDEFEDKRCVTLGQPDTDAEGRVWAYWQYLLAADELLNHRPEPGANPDALVNPACFMLRQAIELALKIAIPMEAGEQGGHLLNERLMRAVARARERGLAAPSPEFVDLVQDFAHHDPAGMGFRYAADGAVAKTCCVDLGRLRRDIVILGEAVESFLRPLTDD